MKNIDYYIGEKVNKKMNGGERRTKVYQFPEDGVILVEKEETDFDILKEKIKRCTLLGVNITEYFNYKSNIDGGEYYILEELAKGKPLDELLNNENGQNIVNNIPYEHIEKYIRDSYLLERNGIGTEPRRRNIIYDEEKGFTIIDVTDIKKGKKDNSLEQVNYFFSMYSNVLLPFFSNDKYGQLIREKTILNMIKAFENGHPYFKKYSRFIYRNNKEYSKVLENDGIDLTLNETETKNLEEYINLLINDIIKAKVSNEEDLFHSTKTSYINLLSSSIDYCPNFTLFNKDDIELKDYINRQVQNEIKDLFINNPNDESLKKLFYKIRKNELDPLCIYPDELKDYTISNEINEILNRKKNKIK